MRKRAFSLIELLIVFIIIGIIVAIGVVTLSRSWDVVCKYAYTKLYNALTVTVYNYMANSQADSDTNSTFPKTSEGFCKALVTYMNTSDNKNENDNDCSSEKNITTNDPSIEDFTDDKVQIRLANGAKIWIGALETPVNNAEYFTYTDAINGLSANYYIVYADLNGDMAPNSITKEGRNIPDIVAFAVTNKYTVVPLGIPTVDRRYLTSYIVYLNTSDGEEDDGEGEYTVNETASDAMTYYEAKVQAYGTYDDKDGLPNPKRLVGEDVIHSYDFENNVFKSGNPLRVNNPKDYFKTLPKFSKENCGNNYELGDSNLLESLCEIKIYDYN